MVSGERFIDNRTIEGSIPDMRATGTRRRARANMTPDEQPSKGPVVATFGDTRRRHCARRLLTRSVTAT